MAVGIRAGPDVIEAATRKPLFKLPAPSASVTSSYAVGKESRTFLVREPLENPQPLQLIENWPRFLEIVRPGSKTSWLRQQLFRTTAVSRHAVHMPPPG